MNRTILTTALFCLLTAAGRPALDAQDLAADLGCMQSAYATMERFYAELHMEVYQRGGGKPAMVQKGIVRKRGNAFLYDYEGTKMLCNDAVILILDEREKRATLGRRSHDPDLEALMARQAPDMDSLIALCDSVAFRGMVDGLKHYTIFTSGQVIQRTDLWIHDGTGLLRKMEYRYDPRVYAEFNRVIVRFEKTDIDPHFPKSLFSESRFLAGAPDNYRLKPPYDAYELIVSQTEEN